MTVTATRKVSSLSPWVMTMNNAPNHIISDIMALDELIAKGRHYVATHPDDEELRRSVRQYEGLRTKLSEELQAALVTHRQHCISYIFKDASPGSMSLDKLTTALQTLNSLVANTFKAFCGTRMDLNFEMAFKGSFGVLLSTPFDDCLLESDFERGLSTVFDTIDRIGKEGVDTKELLRKKLRGNKELVKKFTSFFNTIIKNESPIELRWQSVSGEQPRSTFVPIERARTLHDLFAEHARKDPETILLNGVIKGISLIRNSVDIQYYVKGKAKPKAYMAVPFSPELVGQVKSAFDRPAALTIQVDYDYNDLTGVETPHRSLVTISTT
jgi:hypothetical protein